VVCLAAVALQQHVKRRLVTPCPVPSHPIPPPSPDQTSPDQVASLAVHTLMSLLSLTLEILKCAVGPSGKWVRIMALGVFLSSFTTTTSVKSCTQRRHPHK
jgi:hypothetical protein